MLEDSDDPRLPHLLLISQSAATVAPEERPWPPYWQYVQKSFRWIASRSNVGCKVKQRLGIRFGGLVFRVLGSRVCRRQTNKSSSLGRSQAQFSSKGLRLAELRVDPLITASTQLRCSRAPYSPHDGLWTFHQTSTCLRVINFRALCGALLVTLPPKFGGPETLVVHQVDYLR